MANFNKKVLLVLLIIVAITITGCTNSEQPKTTQQAKQETKNEAPVNTEEKKFGLSESQRKQFFKDIVAAEDQANKEAEELYPTDSSNHTLWDGNTWLQEKFEENMDKYIDYSRELMKKYKAKVREEYNLTEEQETKIVIEAFDKKWPLD